MMRINEAYTCAYRCHRVCFHIHILSDGHCKCVCIAYAEVNETVDKRKRMKEREFASFVIHQYQLNMLKCNKQDFHHDIRFTFLYYRRERKNSNDNDFINSHNGNKRKRQR